MSTKKKMGRPIVGEPKNVRLELRLDVDSAKRLEEIAKREGISKAEVIRRLLKEN